ncbi:MAG: hypothetical protein OSJ45_12580 [Lachnospiraceae bacterium]|nr:hypothetical protein [Lachnospiraceae bacterium]
MESNDTIQLLKECDSGTKMAVESIDEVLDKVKATELRDVLNESRMHHEKLGNELHSLLLKHNSEEKEPAPMAKGMSWLKTNFKMAMDGSDKSIASLITDGCNMGVKSLHMYMNQYTGADNASKDICSRLISIEDKLCKDMQPYL